jgi:hypothetical protein
MTPRTSRHSSARRTDMVRHETVLLRCGSDGSKAGRCIRLLNCSIAPIPLFEAF